MHLYLNSYIHLFTCTYVHTIMSIHEYTHFSVSLLLSFSITFCIYTPASFAFGHGWVALRWHMGAPGVKFFIFQILSNVYFSIHFLFLHLFSIFWVCLFHLDFFEIGKLPFVGTGRIRFVHFLFLNQFFRPIISIW